MPYHVSADWIIVQRQRAEGNRMLATGFVHSGPAMQELTECDTLGWSSGFSLLPAA